MSEVYGYRGYQDVDETLKQHQEHDAEERLKMRARIMEMITRHHDAAWHMRYRRREQILKGDDR